MPRRIVVIDFVEYEIVPLDSFLSSPLCGTTSQHLADARNPEDDDHECRVEHARHARTFVKRPFGKDTK